MITLHIGSKIEYQFDFEPLPQTFDIDLGAKPTNYHIVLDLIPVNNITPHEQFLVHPSTDPHSAWANLIRSIVENGFTYPILSTRDEYKNRWIIADGTHRVEAMKELGITFIPAIILSHNSPNGQFKRTSWSKIIPKESIESFPVLPSNIKVKKLTISPIKDNGSSLRECNHTISQLLIDPNVLGIYRKDNQYYLLEPELHVNRKDHLELIYWLDTNNDPIYKRYLTLDQTLKDQEDMFIFSPPNDALGDLYYLAQFPELRRVKGSKTLVPWRIIQYPIPLAALKNSYDEALKTLEDTMDRYIKIGIKYTFLENGCIKSVDNALFDHYLFIIDFLEFSKTISKDEREKFQKVCYDLSFIQKIKK